MSILIDGKIDATNPANLSDKILDEKETRKRLLTHARIAEMERGVRGLEREMLMLFAKADKMMKSCVNDKERKDMGKLFAVEAYRILGGGGELYVDGQLVCKDKDYHNPHTSPLSVVKTNK